MKIGIYANQTRDIDFIVTDKLISLLNSRHIEFAVFENYTHGNVKLLDLVSLSKFADFMIVLGGDGTILQVSKECSKDNVPVAGINLGHIGFLLDYTEKDFEKLLDALVNKTYKLEERSLIEIQGDKDKYLALNDIVLSKGENTKLINITAKVDNMLLDTYYCDGIIVATPTGSTAYSMSNGGPIVAPNVEGLIINPISSHSLHSRPIVISDKSYVELECSKLINDCQLVVDGEFCEKIKNNKKLIIKKSDCKASFIKVLDSNFYEILLKKLNKWSVTEE